MPQIECARCGRMTNTALCDWVDCIDTGKAARCYAAWDEVKKCWVEGCAVNDEDADWFSVKFAKKYHRGEK
ncbi:hypothetical protein LCGC14_2860250 [marine sediment metagenome]|uniref:Uncharacterized protein n=1 Tax=marine sediment metagenome TaxID=412755 RepID=A0A0F9AE65_9ZZZZ